MLDDHTQQMFTLTLKTDFTELQGLVLDIRQKNDEMF